MFLPEAAQDFTFESKTAFKLISFAGVELPGREDTEFT